MRMQVCGVLRAYLKDDGRCWYYPQDSIVALDTYDYWSFYCAGCVVEGEWIIVANDLSLGMFNDAFHLHFQHGIEWVKFWKMNDNVEGSGRGVFKTLIPDWIFTDWGKLRKILYQNPVEFRSSKIHCRNANHSAAKFVIWVRKYMEEDGSDVFHGKSRQ